MSYDSLGYVLRNSFYLKIEDGNLIPKRPSTDIYDENWFRSRSTLNESGCWVWNGAKRRGGYGYLNRMVFQGPVHRWAHTCLIGPIPEGFEVDHVAARGCTDLACCNPAHLEAVTPQENNRRSGSVASLNALKTHCSRGHEFTTANTRLIKRGGRVCKTCERVAHRKQARKAYRRKVGTVQYMRLLGDDEVRSDAVNYLAD